MVTTVRDSLLHEKLKLKVMVGYLLATERDLSHSQVIVEVKNLIGLFGFIADLFNCELQTDVNALIFY